MSKRFLIILAVLFAVFAGFIIFSKRGNKSSNTDSSTQASQHIQGSGNKSVVFLEYGDFQCPYCADYFPIVEQVRQHYGDDITFQFRNFPLVNLHQNAMAASRAAEAANKQGKFWEMYTLLYERQKSWDNSSDPTKIFEAYAAELGLDINQFNADYNSAEVSAIINADVKAGQALDLTSTPTFFINGKKLDNPPTSVDGFIQLIDQAIANATNNQ